MLHRAWQLAQGGGRRSASTYAPLRRSKDFLQRTRLPIRSSPRSSLHLSADSPWFTSTRQAWPARNTYTRSFSSTGNHGKSAPSQKRPPPPKQWARLPPKHQQTLRPEHQQPAPHSQHEPSGRQWEHASPYRYDPVAAARAEPLLDPKVLRSKNAGVGALVVAIALFTFYHANMEEVPLTGRRRFNCYAWETVVEDSHRTCRLLLDEFNGYIIPDSHPGVQQVNRVMKRLSAASGVDGEPWTVHVVSCSDRNAFVLPNNHVFVFTGLLEMAPSDDALAAILGHEMSHVLARHEAENRSRSFLWQLPLWLLEYTDSIGLTMGLGRYLGDRALTMGIMLPGSRVQETEADEIGLMLMAKCCYDPRAAVSLWERMEHLEAREELKTPEFLSTHPTSGKRVENLSALLSRADMVRESAGCDPVRQTSAQFWHLFQTSSAG